MSSFSHLIAHSLRLHTLWIHLHTLRFFCVLFCPQTPTLLQTSVRSPFMHTHFLHTPHTYHMHSPFTHTLFSHSLTFSPLTLHSPPAHLTLSRSTRSPLALLPFSCPSLLLILQNQVETRHCILIAKSSSKNKHVPQRTKNYDCPRKFQASLFRPIPKVIIIAKLSLFKL